MAADLAAAEGAAAVTRASIKSLLLQSNCNTKQSEQESDPKKKETTQQSR
jgi:hypothetical protein